MIMNQTGDTQEALVSCVWLAGRLDDPKVRVIEVSAANDDAKYRTGHIPGAAWWFWKDALWHATDREFITPEQLAQRLGSMGVSPTDTVVIYGDPVQFGTYAFWVLTMAGHKNLRLLDGGRKRWIAEGRPLSQKSPDSSSGGLYARNGGLHQPGGPERRASQTGPTGAAIAGCARAGGIPG